MRRVAGASIRASELIVAHCECRAASTASNRTAADRAEAPTAPIEHLCRQCYRCVRPFRFLLAMLLANRLDVRGGQAADGQREREGAGRLGSKTSVETTIQYNPSCLLLRSWSSSTYWFKPTHSTHYIIRSTTEDCKTTTKERN